MKVKISSYNHSFSKAFGIGKNVPLDLIHAHLKTRIGQGVKHVKHKIPNEYNPEFLMKNMGS